MILSRIPRSKSLQVIKEKIKPNSYKYDAIEPEAIPSSSELNSINNIISYNNLGSANNYYDLISSNNYNVLAYPNNYKDLVYSKQYLVPPTSNQYWTATSKYDVLPSANQYYDPNSANNLDAPVEHIDINDLVPLQNGRRVDHGNDRDNDNNGNRFDHDQNAHHGDHGRNGDYDYEDHVVYVDNINRGDSNHYVDIGRYGRRGDHSQQIDLRKHGRRGEYKDHGNNPRRKVFRKKHKKRVHQPESRYSQESLELVYNSLHNVINMDQFSIDDDDEALEQTRSRNHKLRQSRNRNRKRARHHERSFVQDYKRSLDEKNDYGLIYDYGHDTKRGRYYDGHDDDDSFEYPYTVEHNYNDNYNDLSHEYDIDKYVDTHTNQRISVPHRRPRQYLPQDAIFISDNTSPFNMESFYDESLSSDEEPVHIPILGYQQPVQSMLQAVQTDVRSQPIVPQIGVLPFLGVSAIYHQPISKKSVDLIKDVAHSYQENAKEQYKEMAKYFPPLPPQPPFPLPDCSKNDTAISPVEYYPGQRKDDKLMNKIRHKILENAKHFRKDGDRKHKVTKGGSSQENIYLRQHK